MFEKFTNAIASLIPRKIVPAETVTVSDTLNKMLRSNLIWEQTKVEFYHGESGALSKFKNVLTQRGLTLESAQALATNLASALKSEVAFPRPSETSYIVPNSQGTFNFVVAPEVLAYLAKKLHTQQFEGGRYAEQTYWKENKLEIFDHNKLVKSGNIKLSGFMDQKQAQKLFDILTFDPQVLDSNQELRIVNYPNGTARLFIGDRNLVDGFISGNAREDSFDYPLANASLPARAKTASPLLDLFSRTQKILLGGWRREAA